MAEMCGSSRSHEIAQKVFKQSRGKRCLWEDLGEVLKMPVVFSCCCGGDQGECR